MNKSVKRAAAKAQAKLEQTKARLANDGHPKPTPGSFYLAPLPTITRPYAERPNRNIIEKAFAAIAKRAQEEACKPASPKDGMEPTVAVQTPSTEPSVKVDAGVV